MKKLVKCQGRKKDVEVKEETKSVEETVKEAVANALKEQKEELDAKQKKRRKIIRRIVLGLIIIAIIVFLLFFLKFKVTFKYNNGKEDKVIKINFLRKIPDSEVEKDLVAPKGYVFAGYAETYYLNGEQIATIKNDSSKEKDICKPDFKLNSETVKCVSEYKFDFENTKCIREEKEPAEKERVCPSSYTLVYHDRCINLNNTTNKIEGYICEYENSKLKFDQCIIYERIEAKIK